MKTKSKNLIKTAVACFLMVFTIAGLTACGSGNALVGEWISDAEYDPEVLKFNKDGSCSVPFTYDNNSWESADSYTIDKDGTLIFSSKEDNDSYKKVESEEEALDDKDTYYISGDTLIIEKDKYTKNK